MMEIEFIPVIEPSTYKNLRSEPFPSGTAYNNPAEWDIYQRREIEKSYCNFPAPIISGIFQYKLFDIELEDLEKVINLHLGDTNISESISLFGGYAISLNGNIELFPQCCGLLEEINAWESILNENFKDFYLCEMHPSPLVTKKRNEIIIYCKDDYESFIPFTTREEIRLDYVETKAALIKLLKNLADFSNVINSLSNKFGCQNLANIMIWGRKENK